MVEQSLYFVKTHYLVYDYGMRSYFSLSILILIIIFLFKDRIKKTEIFRSLSTIFNIVFYIYLIALVSVFIYQIIYWIFGPS